MSVLCVGPVYALEHTSCHSSQTHVDMPPIISLQLEERAQSAAERLQRVRRQGQDLRQLGLTDKEAANQKLQATLQRTLTVCPQLPGGSPL